MKITKEKSDRFNTQNITNYDLDDYDSMAKYNNLVKEYNEIAIDRNRLLNQYNHLKIYYNGLIKEIAPNKDIVPLTYFDSDLLDLEINTTSLNNNSWRTKINNLKVRTEDLKIRMEDLKQKIDLDN